MGTSEPMVHKADFDQNNIEQAADQVDVITAPQGTNAKESAHPGRSRKRKAGNNPSRDEVNIRLGQQIERTSERLLRGHRPMKLSAEDKASQMTLDDSHKNISSTKGYCMVRATHGCHEGTWYYEVTINKLGVSGAVRVGWATRVCDLQTPVGADAGGFAIRSVDGSKVHEGVREDYGEPFDEGDVVGCLISMPPGGRSLEKTVDDVVKYKGQLYFTEEVVPVEARVLPGSFVQFSRNGRPLGKAYEDIREGTYYPAISIFTGTNQIEPASVSVEFGDCGLKYQLPNVEGRCSEPICRVAELKLQYNA